MSLYDDREKEGRVKWGEKQGERYTLTTICPHTHTHTHTHTRGGQDLRLLAAQVFQVLCFQAVGVDAVAIETVLQNQ